MINKKYNEIPIEGYNIYKIGEVTTDSGLFVLDNLEIRIPRQSFREISRLLKLGEELDLR